MLEHYEVGYNVQLSVSKNQIIIANDITRSKNDINEFIPQIKNIQENTELKKDTKIGLDCGYSDGKNFKFAEDNKLDVYVPNKTQVQEIEDRDKHQINDNYEYDSEKDEIISNGHRYSFCCISTCKTGKKTLEYYNKKFKKRKVVPFYFRERLRMKTKMDTEEAKRIYALRKITVEPVYGNIKENLGFREFLLRGIENTKIEFNIACIAHNLKKIKNLLKEKTKNPERIVRENQEFRRFLATHN